MVMVMMVCIIFLVSPIREGNFLGRWLLYVCVWINVRLKSSIGLVVISLMGGAQYIQGTR